VILPRLMALVLSRINFLVGVEQKGDGDESESQFPGEGGRGASVLFRGPNRANIMTGTVCVLQPMGRCCPTSRDQGNLPGGLSLILYTVFCVRFYAQPEQLSPKPKDQLWNLEKA